MDSNLKKRNSETTEEELTLRKKTRSSSMKEGDELLKEKNTILSTIELFKNFDYDNSDLKKVLSTQNKRQITVEDSQELLAINNLERSKSDFPVRNSENQTIEIIAELFAKFQRREGGGKRESIFADVEKFKIFFYYLDSLMDQEINKIVEENNNPMNQHRNRINSADAANN